MELDEETFRALWYPNLWVESLLSHRPDRLFSWGSVRAAREQEKATRETPKCKVCKRSFKAKKGAQFCSPKCKNKQNNIAKQPSWRRAKEG